MGNSHAVDAHRKPTTHGIAQAESTTPGARSSRPPKLSPCCCWEDRFPQPLSLSLCHEGSTHHGTEDEDDGRVLPHRLPGDRLRLASGICTATMPEQTR